jgi:hypothetical protein
MDLPQRVREIIDELYMRHTELARGDENQRRLVTQFLAEQCCYELGPRWGMKRPSLGRPPGKDSIAYNDPAGMVSWDWQDGQSRMPHNVPHFWSAGELTRTNQGQPQIFIPVEPRNHLGLPSVPPTSVPEPTPPLPIDVAALLERIDRLEQRCSELAAQMAMDLAELRTRRYVASKWGITIVSVPEESPPDPSR